MNDIFSLHDSHIIFYSVDIQNKTIKMVTQNLNEEPHEVIFDEVLSHYFENVMVNNIIFDIEKISVDTFIENQKELIENSLPYGFPVNIESNTTKELKKYLIDKNFKVYDINSTIGLCGFVIAKNMSIK